jgi:protein-L-isoaspartate O-methyltransferase
LPKIKLCVKVNQIGCGYGFQSASLAQVAPAQQSVHPTLGILARFQAVFYA